MFDNLSERLSQAFKKISGKGRITEDNVKDILREVRTALLEADVALSVVKSFTAKVKERALGQEVSQSLTPDQEFIKIVYDQLVETMGAKNDALNVAHQPPAVILLAGLQGAGKTTSAAKLALKFVVSKWVMGPTPHFPARMADQKVGISLPMGVTAPMPVITTRLFSIVPPYMAMPPSTQSTWPVT